MCVNIVINEWPEKTSEPNEWVHCHDDNASVWKLPSQLAQNLSHISPAVGYTHKTIERCVVCVKFDHHDVGLSCDYLLYVGQSPVRGRTATSNRFDRYRLLHTFTERVF